jgi:hypothetical protein
MSDRAGTVVQIARPDGSAAYLELGAGELAGLASALEGILRSAGLEKGHRLLVYDFSAAINVLPLTRAYAPGLQEGACDSIGCSVLSLDGLAALAPRTAFFLSLLRPEALMIRGDLLPPLRARLGRDVLAVDPNLRSLITVTSDASDPFGGTGGIEGVAMYSIYRVDAALFMALMRPDGRLSYSRDLYESRCSGGRLSVRPSFARVPGFVETSLRCAGREVVAT